jgi:ribosomal protein S26
MRANEFITEGWSQKYKSSINCSHPKGFSQKAHCAGKKKHNESTAMEMTCPDCGISEDWNKVNRRDKTDGLSKKAVKAYRRENPGSKLQTAVTTKPSKLKPGSKAAKRRKSFCARMSGNKGPMKDDKGRPTPKAKALRRWNCESIEDMRQMILLAEATIKQMKSKNDKSI